MGHYFLLSRKRWTIIHLGMAVCYFITSLTSDFTHCILILKMANLVYYIRLFYIFWRSPPCHLSFILRALGAFHSSLSFLESLRVTAIHQTSSRLFLSWLPQRESEGEGERARACTWAEKTPSQTDVGTMRWRLGGWWRCLWCVFAWCVWELVWALLPSFRARIPHL